MVYIVYKTLNIINDKIYIGIHKQKDESFDGYLGSGVILTRAIEKYGKQNFIRETLHVFNTIEEARQKEREIVNEEFCMSDQTYNISIGGTGGDTTAGYDEVQMALIQQKRHVTNIERGNYVYRDEKLSAAIGRMKTARIQPDNKGKIHSQKSIDTMRKASKKRTGKYTWITNGNETKIHDILAKIPDDWYNGRGSDVAKFIKHTDEARKKISKSILGDVCFNNGVKNLKLKIGDSPPDGYVLGMIQNHGKKRWITNGIISRKIEENGSVPEGWYYGKKFKKQEESV